VVILEGVLVECLYVLTKGYGETRAETGAALTGLLHYKGVINADKDALLQGLALFAQGKLDPVDCLLLARSRHDGLGIFSFDAALNKAAPLQ